jgi:hypothetical protein
MVRLSKEKETQMFGIDGVLGSFSAKIKTAFAFGFIDADLRDQFDRIREIRNVFAHSKIAIDFKTPEIHHACVGLLKSSDATAIDPRAVYSNAAYFLMHAATLTLMRSVRGENNTPLTYEEALAFFARSTIPHLPQIPMNPMEEPGS